MLRVYHSNRLDVLEALMEFIVERERLDDPFEPEMILVQSTGMAQWLQMTLSQKFGIAANIDFPLPASFIWDMFVRVLPEIPKESAFNKQSMSWKLMTLLPQLLEREDFTLLRHYLTDDSDKRKLFQLSSKRRTCLTSIWFIVRTGWHSGKQDIWLKGWEKHRPGKPIVEGAGGIYPSTRATALAPRQSLSALYRNAGVRDDPPAGVTFARLYMRYFRVTACLSPGATGAG